MILILTKERLCSRGDPVDSAAAIEFGGGDDIMRINIMFTNI